MNLFIDTNVYLSFFHFAKDELQELTKLAERLKKRELTLFIPQQVIDEFHRNRSNKIADALKQIKGVGALNYPQVFHEFEEHAKVKEHHQQAVKLHIALMTKVEAASRERSFLADKVIGELFHLGARIESDKHLTAARERRELGKPPGKKDSLGDALNWETLLEIIPEREDLHFVSEDGDWLSPLDPTIFNSYLIDEWESKKRSKIAYYARLSEFFAKSNIDIDLRTEKEKDRLINALAGSMNFLQTHTILASLAAYSDFSTAQLNGIVGAYVSNEQVYWIIGDKDVKSFITKVIAGRTTEIEPSLLDQLKELFDQAEG